MTLSDYVEEKLIELGATPEYTGYKYLYSAIMMAMKNESVLSRVTIDLYPALGEKYGASPSSVERSMRTAVAAIWCDGERETRKAILGRSYNEQLGNAKFVAIASKRLLISYRNAMRESGNEARQR